MDISIGQNWLNKKNPFEYIVPPPTSGVGTINGINKKQKRTLEKNTSEFIIHASRIA